ncbi:MAG TPA: hypothetical protein VM580_11475, partial [Labilithrix sp.]|nr:hypothetical protein [Labilithrix sp.]
MKITGVDDLQSLIERTCWTGEFCPFFAWALGIQVHHLFWNPDVMNAAFRIPLEFSFDGSEEKVLLRNMAAERGHMDPRHVRRKKQALTDGTQFHRVLSSALGLSESYAYDQKSSRCISHLRTILERAPREDQVP